MWSACSLYVCKLLTTKNYLILLHGPQWRVESPRYFPLKLLQFGPSPSNLKIPRRLTPCAVKSSLSKIIFWSFLSFVCPKRLPNLGWLIPLQYSLMTSIIVSPLRLNAVLPLSSVSPIPTFFSLTRARICYQTTFGRAFLMSFWALSRNPLPFFSTCLRRLSLFSLWSQ